jgi:hypothetical protein
MATQCKIVGKDIPIDELIPMNERDINFKTNRGYRKIVSSITTIGLIEPLCVHQNHEGYFILDGYLRYKALEQLGVEKIPCLVSDTKEAYTYNRMVNRLSPYQESRMLRESLKKIKKETIADVFGIKSISHRLGTEINDHLHPDVIRIIDKTLISRNCATELTHVNHDRQLEIINKMKQSNDYSISLARALIIKTSPEDRNHKKKYNKNRPWLQNSGKKQELVSKLEQVGKRYDFYINLYRQYSIDLFRLCIFVRKLITNKPIKEYIGVKHADLLTHFENIIFDVEKKAV